MKPSPLRVAVIGGGPAGASLSVLLHRKGCQVTMWDSGKRPSLIVGESLIPAVVPILRRLGIEEEVAGMGVKKPGVSFQVTGGQTVRFSFMSVDGVLPTYAYNVPRPGFDLLLNERARSCGVSIVDSKAEIDYDQSSDLVRLDRRSLRDAGWDSQPDLVVDCSGRSRYLTRRLGLTEERGPRNDTAIFSHFDKVPPLNGDPAGQVTIARSSHGGWTWRIPLRGATSVGVVIPTKIARNLGSSADKRLEQAILQDEFLRPALTDSQRLTSAATYSNYQLVTGKAWGSNWVLCGDAFGFVDPMLSPGICLALGSATWLAERLPRAAGGPLAPSLDAFASHFRNELAAWSELIGHFYSGNIFNLYFNGGKSDGDFSNPFSRKIAEHVSSQISCMCAGASTTSRYSRQLVNFSAKYGADPTQASAFAIA